MLQSDVSLGERPVSEKSNYKRIVVAAIYSFQNMFSIGTSSSTTKAQHKVKA
ncbi:DNA-directed DNA polymerase [Ascosphaera pollenicola]|nr:DNA-directed DNA polymerase [Ascosphaera pollenicola]